MYGNVLTGAAGFLLASAGMVDWWLFVATITGMVLVVSAACALNNYLDQDIDSIMERTRSRPSVTGVVPRWSIVLEAVLLLVAGALILMLFTNWLVVAVGLFGFVVYVWLYGAWSKRRSIYGTAVGSVSGAMPIVGGYVAVTGQFDIGALLVFLILFFWQFPEFFSIAIYRRQEYAAANVPVMSVVRGVKSTTVQIFYYSVLYVIATLGLVAVGLVGWTFMLVMTAFGVWLIYVARRGLFAKAPAKWARQMFHHTMINLLVFCAMCVIGPLLP
jgi:protoheme IX farnesyltransferase